MNNHPLEVAAVWVAASLQALAHLLRLLLVHTVALVLTLSGWNPEPSTDVLDDPQPEPEPKPQPALTVPQLRAMARQDLGSAATVGGRRIAQARKADLLQALQLTPAIN